MTQPNENQAARLLGYPVDARLLILNADDFGFCSAINEAIMQAFAVGTIRSTTLMVPCPWSFQAARFLTDHPAIPFGVHLTAISDSDAYRWRPVTPWDTVPSLVDRAGYFHNFDAFHANLTQVNLRELEVEFRAQIESVLAAGLRPTHLDWHAIRFGPRNDIVEMMIRLAQAYGLALRVIGQRWIETLQGQGLPTIDYDFLDSYSLDPLSKPARFTQLLRDLPPGLSEWAIHPGLANAELLSMEPTGAHYRQADFEFWTSPQAQEIIDQEGIILLDYRALQAVWRE